MTWLPAVDQEGQERLLPLSRGTANALLRWLLSDSLDAAPLSRSLVVDPLAIWWLQYQIPRLRTSNSLMELATRLDRGALQHALRGRSDRGPTPHDLRRGARIALAAADDICRSAASLRDACRSPHVLALLLRHAQCWWSEKRSAIPEPRCQGNNGDWTDAMLAARLHDQSPLGRILCHRIQSTWRPDGGASAHRLTALHDRLRRLEQLEQDFAYRVEQAKLAALREFAYGASHEINNPLTNIAARAQLMLKEAQSPEDSKALRVIHQQAMRAFQMIADLSLFAKPPAMHPERVQVASLLEDIVRKVTREAAARSPHLEIVVRAGRSLGWIDADRTQLLVAVDALCRNAMEAMGERGTLALVAAGGCDPYGRPELRLRVRDSGPGIPSDVLPHIFDPFFSGREAGRGLGFGLCTAWRIVTDHGGRIWPDSGPRRGCRFTICLPHYIPRA